MPVAGLVRGPLRDGGQSIVPGEDTVPEFIAYAKANPGKINMAIGRHRQRRNIVYGELFKMMAGINWSMCRIAARRRR